VAQYQGAKGLHRRGQFTMEECHQQSVSRISTWAYPIYINDLDNGVRNWMLKFADDTKIFSKMNNAEDGRKQQDDLDRLERWSEEW